MQLLIQQAVLTNFRPIFIVMLAILAIFLILSIIPRGRNSNINFVTVLTVSIIEVVIAAVLFYTESNLVELFEQTPDNLTLYLFIGIIGLGIANPIIFRLRNSGGQRYRYHY
ncbi:hypothetical protein SAMN02745249_00694 [Atopostipes suicloacalis DSM 15692]|uniref:Uncharacterized protein n=1 Tax=Atopostipes suicloacalis DSM 15692 TaxID=1121025 RepID=A0A1M4UIR1_9LACT|nr:hypothetical protein [Atopostipes suicloacalis]SHE56545.1 hypothetical protein SAMN02745249_00694 [Atopostipes suicloacalis DSM 15692]